MLDKALENYTKYLDAGEGQLSEAARKQAEQEMAALRTRLAQEPTSPTGVEKPGAKTLAVLEPSCSLSAVVLEIEGVATARSPFSGAIYLPPGEHNVRFSRQGYLTREEQVTLSPEKPLAIDCNLEVNEAASQYLRRLRILGVPDGATLSLDGAPYDPLIGVPIGEHQLTVRKHGFEDWSGKIEVSSAPVTTVEVNMRESPLDSAAQGRQFTPKTLDAHSHFGPAVLSLGISGVALAAASSGVFLWNQSRSDRWESTDRALMAERQQGLTASDAVADFMARQAANNALNESIKAVQVAWVSGSILALGLLGTATYLYVTEASYSVEGRVTADGGQVSVIVEL